jgi:uncharacterized protein YdaU (DUF1376 family)
MKAPTLAPVIGKIDPAGGPETERVPQMPWYPRDFASATRGWPLAARGAYRELLDAQWDMGSLPDSENALRAIAMAMPTEWRVAWQFVEPKFPIDSDGRRRNPRLETHRIKAVQLVEKQRNGAAATNAKLWGKR